MAISYPTSIDTLTDRASGNTISEDHMNDVQDICEALEAKVGINSSAVTASIDYKVNKFFIAATHIFFAQATPPVGWTTDAAHKDNVLACKADSGVYSVVGADKGSFTITTANMPAHTHTVPQGSTLAAGDYVQRALTSTSTTATSGSTGGGDGLYRPKATVGVIATWS